MNKIKIGKKEYELNNYYQSIHNGRPSWVFDIKANRDEIKPLVIDNQSYVIISTIDEQTSERDLTDECVLFGSMLENSDGTCILTMENYSDIELLQQMINDLLEV